MKETWFDIELHLWFGRFGIHIKWPKHYNMHYIEFDSLPKKKPSKSEG